MRADWTATRSKAYRLAPFYDLVFAAVFLPGRAAFDRGAERSRRISMWGSGPAFVADYSRRNRVSAVTSPSPCAQGQERVAREKLSHIETLAVMDGANVSDFRMLLRRVVAQFVITAVRIRSDAR